MSEPVGSPRLFGSRATAVIAAALLIPVAVMKLTDSEPFPAVILPGSGTILYVSGDSTSFVSLSLIGFDRSGNEVTIDPRPFLDPIPVQYLGVLAGESFGQAHNNPHISVKGFGWTFGVHGHHASEAEQRDARGWLSEKLDGLGLDTTRFVARYDRVTVSLSTSEETAREMVAETEIELD